MKAWMKVLMWLGLGGGIGFFAGFGIGKKAGYSEGREDQAMADRKPDDPYSMDKSVGEMKELLAEQEQEKKNEEALQEYRAGYTYTGGPYAEEHCDEPDLVSLPEDLSVIDGAEGEEEDLPQLHQEHMTPVQITEEEYYNNPWGEEQENLIFYELDEVLFNRETRSAMKTKDEIDQVLGIGATFLFYLKDGEVLDAIFIRNPTMGTLFRVDRMDAAYTDEHESAESPEYEEDDTE